MLKQEEIPSSSNNSKSCLKSKRHVAMSWYFCYEGLILGFWAAFIPKVQKLHHLSNILLGWILLGAVFGGILSLPLAAIFSSRIGSSKSLLIGAIVSTIIIPIIGLKGPVWILVIGLIGLGFGISWIDISVNSQAVLLEKSLNQRILGLFFSIYALGGLFGALIGGALETMDNPIFYDFLGIGIVALIPSILFYFWLIPFHDETQINASEKSVNDINSHVEDNINTLESPLLVENDEKKNDKTDNSLLIGLCTLGVIGFLGEGAMGDWSAIYLTGTLNASPFVSSLGYAFFQLFIAIGRFLSDKLVLQYNAYHLLKLSGVCSSIGLSIVILSPSLISLHQGLSIVICIIGFSVTGAGLSIVAPIIISTAGSSVKHMEPTDAIGTVTSCAYFGVMIGPPLIGSLSGVLGELRYALIVAAGLLSQITTIALILDCVEK